MTAITATVIAPKPRVTSSANSTPSTGRSVFMSRAATASAVVCLKASELNIGTRDVHMGDVLFSDAQVGVSQAGGPASVPVYLMTSEIKYWAGSTLVIDVAAGYAAGFSLEGPRGVHFTLRKRTDPSKRVWDADAILAGGAPAA